MHQIQLIESIKRLFKKYRCEHKAQAEDKQTRSIQKDEGRRNTKTRENHTTVKSVILYFAFMNIVLEIQTKTQLSLNSKLRMHLKQELVLTQRVSPCKVETVFYHQWTQASPLIKVGECNKCVFSSYTGN